MLNFYSIFVSIMTSSNGNLHIGKQMNFPNFMKFSKFIIKFRNFDANWFGNPTSLRLRAAPSLRYSEVGAKSERNIFSHWVEWILKRDNFFQIPHWHGFDKLGIALYRKWPNIVHKATLRFSLLTSVYVPEYHRSR